METQEAHRLPTGSGSPSIVITPSPADDLAPPPRQIARSLIPVRTTAPAARHRAAQPKRSEEEIEAMIRDLLTEDTRMGLNKLVRRARVNVSTAARWGKSILAEADGIGQQGLIAQ